MPLPCFCLQRCYFGPAYGSILSQDGLGLNGLITGSFACMAGGLSPAESMAGART